MVTPDAATVTLPATSMALLVTTQVSVPAVGPEKLISAQIGAGEYAAEPELPVPLIPRNTLQL